MHLPSLKLKFAEYPKVQTPTKIFLLLNKPNEIKIYFTWGYFIIKYN